MINSNFEIGAEIFYGQIEKAYSESKEHAPKPESFKTALDKYIY